MSFYLLFLLILLTSFVMVGMTTAMAIKAGLLPGVVFPRFRVRAAPMAPLRKTFGQLAQIDSASTFATIVLESFVPSSRDAYVYLPTRQVGGNDLVVGKVRDVVMFSSSAQIYRLRSVTATELVEEAA